MSLQPGKLYHENRIAEAQDENGCLQRSGEMEDGTRCERELAGDGTGTIHTDGYCDRIDFSGIRGARCR